jgi:hypothetical protein
MRTMGDQASLDSPRVGNLPSQMNASRSVDSILPRLRSENPLLGDAIDIVSSSQRMPEQVTPWQMI